MDKLKIGLVQYAPAWCDPLASLGRLEELVGESVPTDLLVLPEMSFTGFTMDAAKAELPEEVSARLAELARERKTGIVYGAVENGFNRVVLLDRQGQRTGSYDKRHLFSLGSETLHYLSGQPPRDWNFEGWRIRPAICYDLRFPYHFWNAAQDYDLALLPACWPRSRERHWKTLLSARAIENQAWVVGVNRVGDEPRISYSGASSVMDPQGKTILDAEEREAIHVVEIDREAVALTRGRFPFLSDRKDSAGEWTGLPGYGANPR